VIELVNEVFALMTNGVSVLNGVKVTPMMLKLWIITKGRFTMAEKLHPIHPGEVLLEEFIKPMNLSQNRLAIEIGVDARRVNEIVLGARSITADTALRLARYFGVSPQFWLGLQAEYDLDVAMDKLGNRLEREVRPRQISTAA
jgi:addiction module HigA family antidote